MQKKARSGITSNIDYIIYIFLCLYLIIDSITGYLLMAGYPSVSVVYKPFILLLMLLSVASKHLHVFTYIFFLFVLIFVSFLSHLVNEVSWNFSSLSSPLRIINNQVYFIYFYFLLSKSNISLRMYASNMFLRINIIVFMGSILLGIFGFGFSTYKSGEAGVSGYFYAGNEVGILFMCLYYIVLAKIRIKNNKILFVYILGFIISVTIMTKTAILSGIVISCIDYYFRSSEIRKFAIKLLLPILIFVIIELLVFLLPKTQFYQFFEHRIMNLLKNGGTLINAILSGRIDYLKDNYESWKYHSSPMAIMLGLGSAVLPRETVEIDLFDTFFHSGVLFTVVSLFYYLFLVYASIKIKNPQLLFFNLLYLIISFTAGHVWYSVMAGLFYAYINANELAVYFNKRKIFCQVRER